MSRGNENVVSAARGEFCELEHGLIPSETILHGFSRAMPHDKPHVR